jgi:hypothetical protein
MAFFFTSCGGNEQKTNTETVSTDTTAAATTTAPVITTVTTPQNMVVARHKVSDFAKWKASYEARDSMRLANGIHSYVIGRGLQDSNTVLVAVKVDDMTKAKAFAKSPDLKEAMKKGGVVGAPTFNFLTIVFQDTARLNSEMRSFTTFTVKDWDAWKKAFESNKQLRTDNGLADRAYGHDADDNHKVIVVVALIDSAKANAYWKSDILKQKRAESGVVGEPQRFLYRVVQRY